jgi:hypothetical protein
VIADMAYGVDADRLRCECGFDPLGLFLRPARV